MRYFWTVYLLTAAVSTAGVYHFAPRIRPYMPQFLRVTPATKPNGQTAEPRPAVIMKPVASTVPPPGSRTEPAGAATPKRDATEAPKSAPRVLGPVQTHIKVEDEVIPSLNNIFMAHRLSEATWGVTLKEATIYKNDGTNVGQAPAGTLVECVTIRKSSKGTLMECSAITDKQRSAPILISIRDLRLYTGRYGDLSERQMSALTQFYGLNGAIEKRKTELLKIAASKNPHFQRYEAAYKKIMAHIDKANKLTQERDEATGLMKVRLSDQLRAMKHDEAGIRKEYDAIHNQFKEWKKNNGDAVAKPEEDPEIIRLRGRMAGLRSSVPGLAY